LDSYHFEYEEYKLLAATNRERIREEIHLMKVRPLNSPLFTKRQTSRERALPKKLLTLSALGLISTLAFLSAPHAANAASSLGGTISIRPMFSHWQLLLTIVVLLHTLPHHAINIAGQGLQQLAMWYMVHLHASPVLTKSITAGIIGVIGDFLAQRLEHVLMKRTNNADDASILQHTKKAYDKRRGLSILIDGVFISGPLMHYGYEIFERILPIAGDGGPSSLAAITHVLADSIFLDSIFVATTFVVTGLMEGFSMRKQIIPQLKSDYLSTLMASWVTSIGLLPIEFVCFRYLPVSFRVLAVNFIDVIWDAVISFMAHRNRHEKGEVHSSLSSPTTESATIPTLLMEPIPVALSA